MDIRTRYLLDPTLHAFFDVAVSLLAAGRISPPDLTNAALLATQIYAERLGLTKVERQALEQPLIRSARLRERADIIEWFLHPPGRLPDRIQILLRDKVFEEFIVSVRSGRHEGWARRGDEAQPAPAGELLPLALELARVSLAFGLVKRATAHPDGTPESDATHTVMLGIIAPEIARREGLDPVLASAFATVHDLPEVYALDTSTARGLTPEQREAKDSRETAARERLRTEIGADSWVMQLLERYEAQQEPEARLVRYVDKILPKLTHVQNGGLALRRIGLGARELVEKHHAQGRELAGRYPEFPVVRTLFEQACEAAERACIESPAARVDDASEAELVQLQREIEVRLVQLRAGRLGAPGVRDPDAPCEGYDPSERKLGVLADCETDGHYLCEGCCHRREDADGDGRYSVPPADGHFDRRAVAKGMFPTHIGPAGASYSDGTILAPACTDSAGRPVWADGTPLAPAGDEPEGA